MSEKNPPDSNFMTKLATFIVDKKTLFFLLYIFAVIFCAFSSGWVNVENDVTTYLPEDTETRQGIVAMNDNFTTFATAQIMVSNVTYETAEELSKQIEDVEGVSMVTFDDTPDHYTNASALFDISFDGIVSDEISERALSDVEALMDFTQVNEEVTAKVETNLRDIPSQDTDSTVLYTLKNGEIATRIAVSSSGWSKVTFNGSTYYAVSSYLTTDLNYSADAAGEAGEDGIKTVFTPVNQKVTAKDVVNLRKLPSVEHEDATVVAQLKNGDVATCVGVSDNGWSKLEYKGETCYAVTSYLTPVDICGLPTQPEDDGIQTQFEEMNDLVTAKVEVNLRSLPSVEDPDCVVVASLKNGEVVTRTGINRDVGWSRVEYNGQTLYCVSSYLMAAEAQQKG